MNNQTAPIPPNFIALARRFSMDPKQLGARVLHAFGKSTHRELIVQKMPAEVAELFANEPDAKPRRARK